MKNRSSIRLVAFGTVVFSQSVFAHPGHDHSFWASNAVHSLTFLSLIMLGAASAYTLRKHLARKKITSQNDQ